jgi:hypothetical protein
MADFVITRRGTIRVPWMLRCRRCGTDELFEFHRQAVRAMDTHARWWHIDTDWFNKVLKEGGGITDAY